MRIPWNQIGVQSWKLSRRHAKRLRKRETARRRKQRKAEKTRGRA